MIICVNQPTSSYSDTFLDQFINIFEYLASVSSSFLCVVISIFDDTTSKIVLNFRIL